MDSMDALQKYYSSPGNMGRDTFLAREGSAKRQVRVDDGELVPKSIDKGASEEAIKTVKDHGFDPNSPEGQAKIKELLEGIERKKRDTGVQKSLDILKATATRGRPRKGGPSLGRGTKAASAQNLPEYGGPATNIMSERRKDEAGDHQGESSPKGRGTIGYREYQRLFEWFQGGKRGPKPDCEKYGDCGTGDGDDSEKMLEMSLEKDVNLEKWAQLLAGIGRAAAGGGRAAAKQGIKDEAKDQLQNQATKKLHGSGGGDMGGDGGDDSPIGQPFTLLSVKKSPAVARLVGMAAGWALSSDITDKDVPPHLVREWERAVSQQDKSRLQEEMIRRLRQKLRKSEDDGNFLEGLQTLYKDHAPLPPRYGLLWDAVKHRWTRPEKVGRTVWEVQGKIRYRGTGSGAHERSRSSKGSGGYGVGSAEAGRRFRTVGDAGKMHPHEAKHPGQNALHPFRKPKKRRATSRGGKK